MDGLARTQDEEPFGSLEDKDPLAAKYCESLVRCFENSLFKPGSHTQGWRMEGQAK